MGTRIANHNGRSSKSTKETFGTKHNDRNFAYIGNEHYDLTKMSDNIYALYHADMDFGMEDGKSKNRILNYNQSVVDNGTYNYNNHEQASYSKLFQEHLDVRNEKYIANGKKGMVWSIDDYRFKKQSCAEESLLYLGDKDHEVKNIDNQEFMQMVNKYVAAIENKYPNVKFLDAQLHCDEKAGAINKNRNSFLDGDAVNQIQGARHVHLRRLYIAKDKDGLAYENQSNALKEMNIKSPSETLDDEEFKEFVTQVIAGHPEIFGSLEGEALEKAINKQIKSDKGRFNNPKMTFTNDCRNIWLDICEEHHIDVIREAQDPQMNGRSLTDYMNAKKEETSRALNSNIINKQKEFVVLKTQNNQLTETNNVLEDKIKEKDIIIVSQHQQIDRQIKTINNQRETINFLGQEIKEKQSLLEYIKSLIRRITHMKENVIPNQQNNPFIKDIKRNTAEAYVKTTHAQDEKDFKRADDCISLAENYANVNPEDSLEIEIDLD